MPDIVDSVTRSRMMSGIKAKNTKPEITVRKALHRRGLRYSLHCRDLIGKPDMVFRSHHAVIFVHGCFWHGHDCQLFRLPSTRSDFWKKKIESNQRRDEIVRLQLSKDKWRQLVIWECAVRGKNQNDLDLVASRAEKWVRSNRKTGVIRSK